MRLALLLGLCAVVLVAHGASIRGPYPSVGSTGRAGRVPGGGGASGGGGGGGSGGGEESEVISNALLDPETGATILEPANGYTVLHPE
jgi:hypothetical protein